MSTNASTIVAEKDGVIKSAQRRAKYMVRAQIVSSQAVEVQICSE
jgi:hypothetical protein